MRGSRTIAALIVSCVALSAAVVGAITFGEPDGDAHPFVGTMLFIQNGVGYYSCSGTLLAPDVMLTSGHCVAEGGNPNDVTYVRFDEDALAGRGDYESLQEWLDSEWILATEVIPHPQYDDRSAFPLTYDVGVVILSEPVDTGGVYGILPQIGFLDGVLAQRGNSQNWFTAVGYGMQGVLNPFYQDDWARYRSTTRLVELNSFFNGPGASAKFTNNPGRDQGGTCFGDSGGPILYGDTNVVTAVVSWGITPCIGVDYHFRMDTAIVQDFVAPLL